MEYDVTDLRHYTNFPICGFCYNAWDIIFGRQRTLISCEKWLSFCRWGGCDPDVWDFIDEKTGWPKGMKLNKQGQPKVFFDHKLVIEVPVYDNRVYHRRANSDDNAPWRKTSDRLRGEAMKRKARIKGINLDDVEWEGGDTYPESNYTEPVLVQEVDLEDPELW